MKLRGVYKMHDKIEIMAFSPKILSLTDDKIFSYFKENRNYIKSNEWITFDDFNRKSVKISKTGIAETKEFFEGGNLKNRLSELSNKTQKIALELFHTKAIYDVFIHQNLNINLDFLKMNDSSDKIESISFSIENNIYVDIKKVNVGYWIIMKGISDIKHIIALYTAIINGDSEKLRKLGCKNIKTAIKIT